MTRFFFSGYVKVRLGAGSGLKGQRGMSVKSRRDAGFSLLEIVIALAVMAVALLGLASFISSSGQVEKENGNRSLAYNAARRMLEEMRSTTFADVFSTYKSGETKNTFFVDGLPAGPWTGQWNNPVTGALQDRTDVQGRIFFPVGTDGNLSENPAADPLLATELGMPKDLNRDGDTSDTGLTSYAILPVKIVVTWRSTNGLMSEVKVVTYIAER